MSDGVFKLSGEKLLRALAKLQKVQERASGIFEKGGSLERNLDRIDHYRELRWRYIQWMRLYNAADEAIERTFNTEGFPNIFDVDIGETVNCRTALNDVRPIATAPLVEIITKELVKFGYFDLAQAKNMLGGAVVAGTLAGVGIGSGVGGNLNAKNNTFSTRYQIGNKSVGIDSKELSGTVETENKTNWNWEKGNVGATYGVIASGQIYSLNFFGKAGASKFSGNVKVGDSSVSGSVKTRLIKDGKIDPVLMISAQGKASALSGKLGVQNGSDNFNTHASMSGEVACVEGEIIGGVGHVHYKDKNGVEHDGYGVVGQVGAEAYVAQGKVSGGFNLFGIKVDLSLSGKVGGAGVKAGGAITNDGASGNLDLGLGVGAGVSFNIDWSGFSLKKLKWW